MLTTTIPAYPYKEYADDDDIQAFFAAYNAATQNIVTWMAAVNLPYYPGLTGGLLEWVAEGLYGLEKTSLAQTQTPASGLLNTELLNSDTLNSFTAPQTTYYDITDDVFKRILTWNFYKGDGKRFCMKWLKRRIMRFLVGTNGLDPNPLDPSFVIGPENTQAVSVTVASDVLTVTINGAYISSLVQLQPNILGIFKAAFLGGVLDLPEQYTYAVNIVTSLTATASPGSESAVGIATTLTTGTASVSALGGNGAYTFAWTWLSGGAGITINSPSSSATSFTASGMTRGATLSGTALCTVTDSVGHTATAVVSVSIQNISVPTVSLSTSSISQTGANSTELTASVGATVSGGKSPYSSAWTWQSGGAGIIITSPTLATTSFEATLSPGQTVSGVALYTATDQYGQQATATCSVSLSRVTQVSLSISPPSLSVSSSTTPITTAAATASASGGSGSYSYSWSFAWTSNSDGASYSLGSPAAQSTNVTASGMSAGNTDSGTLTCVATDAYGQQASSSITASFTYLPPLTNTYTTAQAVTVPNGYSTATIEGWAPGAGGGGGDGTLGDPGTGGGAGGYFRSVITVTAGQQIVINEIGLGGAAGPINGSGGNGSSPTQVTAPDGSVMTAYPGTGGGPYVSPTPGTGGSAAGGNQANVAGGNGTVNGARGVAAPGVYGNNPAAYGNGGNGGEKSSGVRGNDGLVIIRFS